MDDFDFGNLFDDSGFDVPDMDFGADGMGFSGIQPDWSGVQDGGILDGIDFMDGIGLSPTLTFGVGAAKVSGVPGIITGVFGGLGLSLDL